MKMTINNKIIFALILSFSVDTIIRSAGVTQLQEVAGSGMFSRGCSNSQSLGEQSAALLSSRAAARIFQGLSPESNLVIKSNDTSVRRRINSELKSDSTISEEDSEDSGFDSFSSCDLDYLPSFEDFKESVQEYVEPDLSNDNDDENKLAQTQPTKVANKVANDVLWKEIKYRRAFNKSQKELNSAATTINNFFRTLLEKKLKSRDAKREVFHYIFGLSDRRLENLCKHFTDLDKLEARKKKLLEGKDNVQLDFEDMFNSEYNHDYCNERESASPSPVQDLSLPAFTNTRSMSRNIPGLQTVKNNSFPVHFVKLGSLSFWSENK